MVGWQRLAVPRRTNEKTRPGDIYYITPDGTKLRSGPDVQRYVCQQEADGQQLAPRVDVRMFSFKWSTSEHDLASLSTSAETEAAVKTKAALQIDVQRLALGKPQESRSARSSGVSACRPL